MFEDLGQGPNDCIAHHLYTFSANLVQSIEICMPVRVLRTIVEIDQVDDWYSSGFEREVIVRDVLLAIQRVFWSRLRENTSRLEHSGSARATIVSTNKAALKLGVVVSRNQHNIRFFTPQLGDDVLHCHPAAGCFRVETVLGNLQAEGLQF